MCGRSAQTNNCNTNFPLSDYAGSGIGWSNTSTNDTITDVRIHGLGRPRHVRADRRWRGDEEILDIIGNAGSRMERRRRQQADRAGLAAGGRTTPSRGMAARRSIRSLTICRTPTVPMTTSAATATGSEPRTVDSGPGGWQVHFDKGVVSYNTQDGLDALHLTGNGSSMTITNTLAYGNMGQQIKVGGTHGIATNNIHLHQLQCTAPGDPRHSGGLQQAPLRFLSRGRYRRSLTVGYGKHRCLLRQCHLLRFRDRN